MSTQTNNIACILDNSAIRRKYYLNNFKHVLSQISENYIISKHNGVVSKFQVSQTQTKATANVLAKQALQKL